MLLAEFEWQRATLIRYLNDKVLIGDWHGVSDAANDIRVLEAEWKGAAPKNV